MLFRSKEKGRRLIAQTRKARHDYSISDVYEAGVVLVGTEVKSLREGRASLVDGYALVEDGEVWLKNVHIPEYDPGTWTNHEPRRSRKLLLHAAEIVRLAAATREKGVTIVPLSMYFKDGRVKVEIGVAVGRKAYDKRQAIAQRDAEREARAAIGRRSKGYAD